jgi:hypothetical protein
MIAAPRGQSEKIVNFTPSLIIAMLKLQLLGRIETSGRLTFFTVTPRASPRTLSFSSFHPIPVYSLATVSCRHCAVPDRAMGQAFGPRHGT